MEKNKKLVIAGAGELAMIAYEYFTYDSAYEVCGFAVERDYIESDTLYELPIVPFEDMQQQFPLPSLKCLWRFPRHNSIA